MASTSFAPFRHRAFTLVWIGALVSNIGTWMEITALSYYVADTSKASWSGIVAAAGFLPTALLSPFAGAWADRFERRTIMILSNSVAGVIAGSVAILVANKSATPGLLALFACFSYNVCGESKRTWHRTAGANRGFGGFGN